MNDFSQIKTNIEGLGGIETREFCGITWESPEDPNVFFTDGNAAVGELTAQLEDGTLVPIPVCEECLAKVSAGFPVSLG